MTCVDIPIQRQGELCDRISPHWPVPAHFELRTVDYARWNGNYAIPWWTRKEGVPYDNEAEIMRGFPHGYEAEIVLDQSAGRLRCSVAIEPNFSPREFQSYVELFPELIRQQGCIAYGEISRWCNTLDEAMGYFIKRGPAPGPWEIEPRRSLDDWRIRVGRDAGPSIDTARFVPLINHVSYKGDLFFNETLTVGFRL